MSCSKDECNISIPMVCLTFVIKLIWIYLSAVSDPFLTRTKSTKFWKQLPLGMRDLYVSLKNKQHLESFFKLLYRQSKGWNIKTKYSEINIFYMKSRTPKNKYNHPNTLVLQTGGEVHFVLRSILHGTFLT